MTRNAILVTGAASGIGLAAAERSVRECLSAGLADRAQRLFERAEEAAWRARFAAG